MISSLDQLQVLLGHSWNLDNRQIPIAGKTVSIFQRFETVQNQIALIGHISSVSLLSVSSETTGLLGIIFVWTCCPAAFELHDVGVSGPRVTRSSHDLSQVPSVVVRQVHPHFVELQPAL